MGFKFDNDDDELSLDIGGDTAKTQSPAPLPPAAKEQEQEPKPKIGIPSKPKPVNPTSDILKDLPRPGQTVSKPSAKEEDNELTSLLKEPPAPAPVRATPLQQKVAEPYMEEPEVEEPQSTLLVEPPVAKNSQPRRYSASALEEPLHLESASILTRQETENTLVKGKGKPFSGARKKVMQIRVAATGLAVFLIASGIYSFLPDPGFVADTNAQVLALDNGNQYESIRTASESYATRLMTDLLNRPSYEVESSLSDRLKVYVNENQVPTLLTSFQLNSYEMGPGLESRDNGKFYQTVISGPFVDNQEVVNIANLERIDTDNDGYKESFIYPIRISAYIKYSTAADEAKLAKTVLPGSISRWVNYVVPVIHNYKNKSTFLYGYPSIVGNTPMNNFSNYKDKYLASPWADTDDDLGSSPEFKTQVVAFLNEWANQSPVGNVTEVESSLKNLLTLSTVTDVTSPLYPTYRIAQGLNKAYKVGETSNLGTSLSEPTPAVAFDVEALPQDAEVTETTIRRVLVTVEWVDNTFASEDTLITPTTIKQQYIITFVGISKWAFIDIKPRFAQ